ncbi:unnamed protein product, partial [Prunus brigantina]
MEQIAIPPGPQQFYLKKKDFVHIWATSISFNFGYDPVREEYKVLQLQIFRKIAEEIFNFRLLIYTSGTEDWRQIHP